METVTAQNLYRQPWSKNDNPNGWVEITTDCNMACPGCYRGCDRPDNPAQHFPLEEVKDIIRSMKRIRNCQSIVLSGGEPLLHPYLGQIVSFIRGLGMDPIIFTNGELLSEALLGDLKKKGLTGLVIRVDSLRVNRRKNESELDGLRQKYADMVHRVGGLTLGYTCVIDRDNLPEVPGVVRWAQKNHNKVSVMVLILKRQIVFDQNSHYVLDTGIELPDLTDELLRGLPGLQFSSFLGSEKEASRIKWLQAYWVAKNNRLIGYAPPKFIELGQNYHHFMKGTYTYIMKRKNYNFSFLKILMLSLVVKDFRKNILRRYFQESFRNIYRPGTKATMQLINIVCPPGFVNGERDLCDACPDAILYNGKLEPSCMLEEIIRHGKLVSMKEKDVMKAY